MVDIGKEEWSRKKTKSIKYCAPKYHNVGPLTDMMAVAAVKSVSQQRKQTVPELPDCQPVPPPRQLPPEQPLPVAKYYRTIGNDLVISWLKGFITVLLFNQHINFGAAIPTSYSPMTLKLLLTSMTVGQFVASTKEVSGGLQCYIDVEAKTIVTCNELEGFKTCFVKYNDSKYIPSAFPFGVLHQYQEAAVVGRGCSTKDKVFYKECETHSYGDNLEKMCFCSFQLCNRSAIQLNCPSIWTLTLLTLSTVFLSASWTGLLVASAAATTASVTASGWVWDPWPPFTHASNVGNRIQPQPPDQPQQLLQQQQDQHQRQLARQGTGPDDQTPQLLLPKQIDIITDSDNSHTSTKTTELDKPSHHPLSERKDDDTNSVVPYDYSS